MGDISGGCQFVFFGSSGHIKGRLKTWPGFWAFSRTERVSKSTCLCPSVSFTCPMGRPKGYSIAATLGIPISRWNSGVMVSVTVENPFSSKKRATSPTDRQHSGQAGVNKTASTSSSFILAATLGIVSSRSTFGSN